MLNKKNLFYFVILLSFSLTIFWVIPIYAHTTELNSFSNALNLTVNNTSNYFDLPNMIVSITSTPSFITMSSTSQNIGDIQKSNKRKTEFEINREKND